MTHLDNILKSRDITLATKVCLVKAMVFPVVMYGCEIWTIKKAELQTIDGFFVVVVVIYLIEANYFTILWWFLPYIDMNQPWVYMNPPSRTLFHIPPHPIPLSCPSALALSALFHASNWTGHLFHIW